MARIKDRVTRWWGGVAAILLTVAGVLNVIWGIAGIRVFAKAEPPMPPMFHETATV